MLKVQLVSASEALEKERVKNKKLEEDIKALKRKLEIANRENEEPRKHVSVQEKPRIEEKRVEGTATDYSNASYIEFL